MDNRYHVSWYIAAIIFFTISCSLDDEVVIPEQYQNLDNLAVFSHPEEVDTLILAREQSYGSTEDVITGGVHFIETDRSGRVFVADFQQDCIHVYIKDGSYLTRLGGSGRGPGEFQSISGMRVVENHLYVLDIMLLRMSAFSLEDLELTDTYTITPRHISEIEDITDARPHQYFIRSDRSFLVRFGWPINFEESDEQRSNLFYLLNQEGEFISGKILDLKGRQYLTASIGGEVRGASLPFLPNSEIALSVDDHIYTSFTEHFLIKKYSPDGEYMKSIYYPFNRVPIRMEDLSTQFPSEYHQRIIQNNKMPEKWPALHTILIDDEDRIWAATKIDDFDVYEWWVLNEEGGLLAQFTWPRDSIIRKIRDGYVYAIENDTQEFVKYRIKFVST